ISSVAYTGFENDNQGQFAFSAMNVGVESAFGPITKTIAGSRYYKSGMVSHTVSAQGEYLLSYWATETVNLTGNGFTIISSYTGETIHGFTFYESIVSFNIPGSINLNCVGEMDELRFYPYEATATTYNYSPIIGISEVLDENNYLSYFEYDDFSRLQYSEDHFGNGLSYTDYHFRNSNIPSDQNYVRTEIATIPGLSRSSLAAATLTNAQSRRSFTFIDGLARPIQQLQVGQSPSGKDIVTYLEYDAYGRQPKTYLPFTTSQSPGQYKNDAKADQLDFYSTGLEWEQTAYPFKETAYEHTPAGRVRKEANPGETWKMGNHNIQYNYRGNYANEVRLFTANTNAAGWKGTTFYAAGTLTVTEITDENENLQITYFDNKERVVLEKRPKSVSTGAGQKEFNFTSTYYIYDDLGRLVVVITPEGFNKLVADGNFTVSASNDLWNYFYNYNKRGLISGKKLPGIDWSYLVYDQLNRAVLNQDPNQAVSGTWTYQKFDVSGRPIITGLVSLAGKTPSQLQDERWLSMAICSESRSESDNGYTNLAYPTTSLEEFTLKYYDDYDFNRDGNADFSPGNSEAARTRNKPTGNYAKVLGSVTALFEKNVLFYDYKGRVVETKGNNHEGKEETELFTYDFAGAVLERSRIHHFTYYPAGGGLGYSGDLIRKVRNEYDHAARLKNTWIQVDEQPEIWTCSNTYNELGQLLTLRLHNWLSGNGTIPVQKAAQTLNYRYNVRGWLTAINDVEDVKERGDYWGMELHYDDGYSLIDAPSQFSGNISWIVWKSSIDEAKRAYGYTYDPMNRLQKAVYGTIAGPGILEANQYTVDELKYDDNGNMKTMRVHGALTYNEETELYSYGVNDDLSYTYNGNQLAAVSDAGSLVAWNSSTDFKDIANATDYSYDGNGNMISDANKSITVNYNHLNLPSLIQQAAEELKVTYTANGIKRKEEITENLQLKTTGYFGDIIHENGKPGRILFDNGYLLIDTLGNWKPFYYIKDYLGNVRVVFKGDDIVWVPSKLTFELNEDEEGSDFPKFTNVSEVRNNEVALQGESSGKLNNEEGPYTEIPVNSGDTLEVSLYYFYVEENPQKAVPAKVNREQPLPASVNLELKPLPVNPLRNDLNYAANKPVYGLQLNIIGLFQALSGKKRNPGSALPNDLFGDTPEAYLELSLRDTSGEEINQWRLEVDTANSWSRLTDSIGIHVPDTLQQYILRVSLHNESERDIWFDTLFLKLGQVSNPVMQVNHYYPYGNLIADISWQEENSDTNIYLYNGKEFHRSLNLSWLDYGARWYDPQVGRWWVVDPLAEKGRSWSMYNYVFDNPVIHIDPDGKWPGPAIGVQMGQLFGSLSYKANNVAGNITKVANYEAQTNKSMPIVKASQEGLVGTKVLSDFSKLVNPVVDNTAAFIQYKTGLTLPHDMGELSVSFESSGSESKISLVGKTKNGPDVNLELGAYESSQGQLKGYLSVNDENLIGQRPEKRDWEMSAKLGPISGVNIGVNANPTTILNTYKSDNFKDRMQNIQQSYSPFTK
ncbi:MAG: RHS repeat-associated core domain-containing protein, partial [Chitinophagales bacterium]|nr:RHS repeat-associated core domain-containing protein [Chitinophagales bacterium]